MHVLIQDLFSQLYVIKVERFRGQALNIQRPTTLALMTANYSCVLVCC